MMDYDDQSLSIDDIVNSKPSFKEAMLSLLNNPEIKEEILDSADGCLNYLMLLDSMEDAE